MPNTWNPASAPVDQSEQAYRDWYQQAYGGAGYTPGGKRPDWAALGSSAAGGDSFAGGMLKPEEAFGVAFALAPRRAKGVNPGDMTIALADGTRGTGRWGPTDPSGGRTFSYTDPKTGKQATYYQTPQERHYRDTFERVSIPKTTRNLNDVGKYTALAGVAYGGAVSLGPAGGSGGGSGSGGSLTWGAGSNAGNLAASGAIEGGAGVGGTTGGALGGLSGVANSISGAGSSGGSMAGSNWGDWIDTLVDVGGALYSGNAAKDAGKTQSAAAAAAIAEQRRQYDLNREDLAPYRAAGSTAIGQLSAGTAEGGDFNRDFTAADFVKDPGYQFRMDQGVNAIQGANAATRGVQNGRTLAELTRYGQDYASGEYSNAYNRFNNDRTTRFNRLGSLAGIGQTATNTGVASGSNTANNIADLTLEQANAKAAGNIGEANAYTSGLESLANLYRNRKYGSADTNWIGG